MERAHPARLQCPFAAAFSCSKAYPKMLTASAPLEPPIFHAEQSPKQTLTIILETPSERTLESPVFSAVPSGQRSIIILYQPPCGWLISSCRSATRGVSTEHVGRWDLDVSYGLLFDGD